jgi:hypothetical protein
VGKRETGQGEVEARGRHSEWRRGEPVKLGMPG